MYLPFPFIIERQSDDVFHFLGILDGRSRGVHRVVVGSVREEHVDRLYPRHFGKRQETVKI